MSTTTRRRHRANGPPACAACEAAPVAHVGHPLYSAWDDQSRPDTSDDCTVMTCGNVASPHQTNVCRATTTAVGPQVNVEAGTTAPEAPLAVSSFRTYTNVYRYDLRA